MRLVQRCWDASEGGLCGGERSTLAAEGLGEAEVVRGDGVAALVGIVVVRIRWFGFGRWCVGAIRCLAHRVDERLRGAQRARCCRHLRTDARRSRMLCSPTYRSECHVRGGP